MAELRAAYLIHGDDHGAIAERRANLKALAEGEAGASGVQILSPEQCTPAGVAGALTEMTFAFGRRVIIAERAELFKQADVEQHLSPAMRDMPPATTVAFFAREEGRAKAPSALHAAVKRANGQIVAQEMVKPWELPRWTVAQGKRLGLQLDIAAAKALLAEVGPRQQRLLRELEKLQLQGSSKVSAEEIEASGSRSSQQQAFKLADALVAGDLQGALSIYLALAAQGERLQGLLYQLVSRLRDAVQVSEKLASGQSESVVRRSLSMPPKAAERFVAEVARQDAQRLVNALVTLSDIELDLRGGAQVRASRRAQAALSEQTLALKAIVSVAQGADL